MTTRTRNITVEEFEAMAADPGNRYFPDAQVTTWERMAAYDPPEGAWPRRARRGHPPPSAAEQIFGVGDTLSGRSEILGFSCPVVDIFAVLDRNPGSNPEVN